MKSLVKRSGKKFDKGFIAKAYFVHIIGPVDKKAAPYHDPKYREIDPMKPSNS
jgi:hypothetical protein